MQSSTLIIFGVCAVAPCTTAAQEHDGPARQLIVGTRHVPPFAIKNSDGTWDGLSIELWRETAAENHGDDELRELGLAQLLQDVADGDVDVDIGAAALTVTQEREKALDFAHPIYSSGLGIMWYTTIHWRTSRSCTYELNGRTMRSPCLRAVRCVNRSIAR